MGFHFTCNLEEQRIKLTILRVNLHGTTLSHTTSLRQAYGTNCCVNQTYIVQRNCYVRHKKCCRILKHVLKPYDMS